jgi:hypothetical protein
MRSSLAAGVVLALILPGPSFAQQVDPLNAFKSLPGVLVVVDDLDPVTGLTQDQLRRDVEQWVQTGGVRLLTRDQYLAAVGRPALLVTIDAVQPSAAELKDLVFFQVRVALFQNVTLQRLPAVPVSASTWNVDRLGFSSKAMASTFIHTGLQDLVDKFVSAYQETNPKGSAAPTASASPAQKGPASSSRGPARAATPTTESKRLVDSARTIAVRQTGGDQDLRSAVEKTLEVWGRFTIASDPSRADVILDLSTAESKAYATLTSSRGQHLWDDVKGVDTKDDKDASPESGNTVPAPPNLQVLGEALVAALQAFVGQ